MNNKKEFNSVIVSAVLILFLIIVSSTASASIDENLQNVTEPSIDQSSDTQALTSAAPKIIETRSPQAKQRVHLPSMEAGLCGKIGAIVIMTL